MDKEIVHEVKVDLDAVQSLSALLPSESIYPSETVYPKGYDMGKTVDIKVDMESETIYNVSI